MENIKFTKMQGCGNDFVIVDNREQALKEENLEKFSKQICRRRTSLGADGVMVLEDSSKAQFKMRLFNPDGSEGEMCGNGARCIARYANIKGIAPSKMVFETLAGLIKAEVYGRDVGIGLPDVSTEEVHKGRVCVKENEFTFFSLNVGVPHCVIFTDTHFSDVQLYQMGKEIRSKKNLFPEGTNVNFVKLINNTSIRVTTYERGVEQITLACGTGSTASALVAFMEFGLQPPVEVFTPGGKLKVDFAYKANSFSNIMLIGETRIVASGVVHPEAFISTNKRR